MATTPGRIRYRCSVRFVPLLLTVPRNCAKNGPADRPLQARFLREVHQRRRGRYEGIGVRVKELTEAMWQRRWFRWVLAFLGWTGVALFFASQTYLSYKYSGGEA